MIKYFLITTLLFITVNKPQKVKSYIILYIEQTRLKSKYQTDFNGLPYDIIRLPIDSLSKLKNYKNEDISHDDHFYEMFEELEKRGAKSIVLPDSKITFLGCVEKKRGSYFYLNKDSLAYSNKKNNYISDHIILRKLKVKSNNRLSYNRETLCYQINFFLSDSEFCSCAYENGYINSRLSRDSVLLFKNGINIINIEESQYVQLKKFFDSYMK